MDKFKNDTNTPKIERYLQFSLGEEYYTANLDIVKEVIPVPETTILPNSPSYLLGIMNLRGQIVTIVDLRKKLNINPRNEDLEEAAIIIELSGVFIGLVVDSINKVLNFDNSEIKEVSQVSSQVEVKYVEGVFQDDSSLTIILNLEKLFNINEIKQLQNRVA